MARRYNEISLKFVVTTLGKTNSLGQPSRWPFFRPLWALPARDGPKTGALRAWTGMAADKLASFPALLRIDRKTFLSRSVQFFSPAIHSVNGLSKG
jgi:hypothetical protein